MKYRAEGTRVVIDEDREPVTVMKVKHGGRRNTKEYVQPLRGVCQCGTAEMARLITTLLNKHESNS